MVAGDGAVTIGMEIGGSRTHRSRPDLLEAIVAATRLEVARREAGRRRGQVEQEAAKASPRAEAFRVALTADGFNVIAECKRRSPSWGVLCADYHPDAIAAAYAAAGAVAVSVLTEPAFFDGALRDLELVRAAVELPVLRKDFVVSEYQLVEARAAGADAALLIVAALGDHELKTLMTAARGLKLAVLVEVHDRVELVRALNAGARIIGVNNRNLRTLEVNLEASRALIAEMPTDTVAVAESGLRTSAELNGLRSIGYDAFLIGGSLMTQLEPGTALRALLSGTSSVSRGRVAQGRERREHGQSKGVWDYAALGCAAGL